MFYLMEIFASILLVIFLIFGFKFLLKFKNAQEPVLFATFVFMVCFSLLSVCVIVEGVQKILNGVSDQYKDFETIRKLDKQSKIQKTKAEFIVVSIKEYLIKTYPEHEKEIFQLINPDNIMVYLAKYPEIKADKTITEFTSTLSANYDGYYQLRKDTEEFLANCRFRRNNPWLIKWLIPVLPEDIKNISKTN